MQRLRLLTFTSLAVLSSCAPPDAALRVNVTVRTVGTARVRADCIRLTISDDTQELKSLTIKRPADDTAVFAVRRGTDLPATVKVQAAGFIGANCSDDATTKLNAQGEAVTGLFPESGVTELEVFVDPPNSTLDSDRDGFVSAVKGGLDCNDTNATIFPGASQVCANTTDTDCDGQGGCDDTECGSATVCLDPPDRVQVTTSIATMLRYECRGPFRVELRNSSGPRLAIRDTPVALTSSLAGVTVHGVSSCTDMPLATFPIPFGQSFFEVYLKADGLAFGNTTFTATASQVATAGRAVVEVHPQPIADLHFTSLPRTVTAGDCSTEQVTLEFRDAMNRHTDVDAPTTITMSSAPGDIMNANIFFSDAACGTDGSMQVLQPGQGTLALHILARRAGNMFTLTATPSGMGVGEMQNLIVQPGAPSKLAFTNAPLVLSTTQMCSAGLFTVQLQDSFDNPVTTSADVPIRATVSGLNNVTLYDTSPPMCSAAATNDFTIANGSNSVSFRAKGMTAPPNLGDIGVAVTSGASITAATQQLRISAGFASKFVMGGGAQSPLASVCSGNPFSIDLRDASDNPASSGSNTSFTLSTVPAADSSFRFYSGAGCQTDLGGVLTIPAGQTSATFYYRGNRAVANFEIRATSTLTPPATFLPGNSIRPGPPGKLIFTAPTAQTAEAGTCTPSLFLANLLDLFDNPTSFSGPQTVTVSSNPAGVTVGASACNIGNTVALAAGINQVSFNAQHTVTSPVTPYALTASVNGFSTAVAATLTVTPGTPTLIVDVPIGQTSSLAAGACQQITLSRRDGFGNNAPTAGATPVTLQFPPSTTWLVYPNSSCMAPVGTVAMNSAYTTTFSVSPRTAGTGQMRASILSGAQSAVVDFTVAPGLPTLIFETPPSGTGAASATQTAGGCTQVTVARKDIYGNDVPLGAARALTPGVINGTTTTHTGSPCLAGNAVASIPLLSTDARGTFYVMATRSLLSGGPQAQTVTAMLDGQTANLTLTVNPGAATTSLALPLGASTSVAANVCIPVTVERRDPFGNLVPVSGATAVTIAPAGLTLFTNPDCTGANAVPVGAASSNRLFSVRASLAGGPTAYTVSMDGQTTPLSVTITPGPTSQFVVQGLPATMASGGCVGPITLRRRDLYNNDTSSGLISVAMSSAQFQFSNASDCSGATAGLAVGIADLAAVSAPFYATATLSGLATMTATLAAATGTANLNVLAGPPAQIVYTTPVRTFTAGLCSGNPNVISVVLRDAAGNTTNALAGGQAFSVSSSSGAANWFTNNGCSTAAPGGNFTVAAGTSALNLFYLDPLAGTPTVTLTNGSGLTNPANQQHTVMLGAAAKLVFTTVPRTFTAATCGGAVNVITVQLQDTPGNPVIAGGAGQNLTAASNSTGIATWYRDNTCTTVATAGLFTIPNGSSTVSLFYIDTRAGTPNVSLTNPSGLTNPTPQSQTVTVGPPTQLVFTSPPQTLAALACSALTTATLEDLGGNIVNTATDRTVTFSALSAGTSFFTNSGCSIPLPSDQVTMTTGTSTASMYFRSDNAGAVTLTAATVPLTSGNQGATITAANPTKIVVTTVPPATLEAGFCQPLVIERQDSLNRATSPNFVTTVGITPPGGVLMFSNATCTNALALTFPIAALASSTTVYVKGVQGSVVGVIPGEQAYTINATSGVLTMGTVVVTVQPMVRRGSCLLGNTSMTCPIAPNLAAIDRTILFFQATPGSGDNNPSDDNVTCRLNLNAGVAEMICNRASNGANINVEWQTVSFAYPYASGGVSVQHVTAGCTMGASVGMPVDVVTTAPRANSFVLFSNRSAAGVADNDGDQFFTAQLTSDTNLRFSQSAAGTTCTQTVDFAAQVVSWAGAVVNRGVTAGSDIATINAPRATVAASPTFIVYSSRMAAGDTGGGNVNNICRRRLRGEITDTSNLNFSRGCTGVAIQDISWEHVRLPAGSTVTQVRGTTASGVATATGTFPSSDLTRTVAFMGGQGQGGSATGSTTFTTSDRVGAALARAVVTSATGLTFTRTSSDLIGDFTAFVVQLTP